MGGRQHCVKNFNVNLTISRNYDNFPSKKQLELGHNFPISKHLKICQNLKESKVGKNTATLVFQRIEFEIFKFLNKK